MHELSLVESGLQSIQPEIENLRSRFENTQELYREVCVLLFFRYGITPTANKLYQLVRKGSMSAPAEALSQFWKTLREKSRVRIAHPELPAALSEAAGEMIGAFWQRAQALAHDSLEVIRQEARADALASQALAEEATRQAQSAQKSFEETQSQLRNCEERLQMIQQLLAKEEEEKAAIQRQLENAIAQSCQIQDALNAREKELEYQRAAATALEERYQASLKQAQLEMERERENLSKTQAELAQSQENALAQQREAQNMLQIARQEFAAELERQRMITVATEERYQEDLRRACQNLDHERSNSLRVQNELDRTRNEAAERASRDRLEIETLQQERIQLSQKFGELEGALSEVRATRDTLQNQLSPSRIRPLQDRTGSNSRKRGGPGQTGGRSRQATA